MQSQEQHLLHLRQLAGQVEEDIKQTDDQAPRVHNFQEGNLPPVPSGTL